VTFFYEGCHSKKINAHRDSLTSPRFNIVHVVRDSVAARSLCCYIFLVVLCDSVIEKNGHKCNVQQKIK